MERKMKKYLILGLLVMVGFSPSSFCSVKDKAEEYSNKLVWKIHNSQDITDETFQVARDFHSLDAAKAKEILMYVTGKLLEWPAPQSLKFLAVVGELYPQDPEYTAICQNTLQKSMTYLLKAHIEDPTLAPLFTGTELSLDALVSRILTTTEEDYKYRDSLRHILWSLGKFSSYEDQIVAAMPAILQKDPTVVGDFLSLSKTERRRSALNHLWTFLGSDVPVDPYWLDSFAEQLFRDYTPVLVESDFDVLYGAFQKRSLYGALQRMWVFMSETNLPQLQRQFLSLWNVPENEIDLSQPWQGFCTQVLDHVLDTECSPLTTLHAFITVHAGMSPTGFLEFIEPKILKDLRRIFIMNEERPLKERVESLTAEANNPDLLRRAQQSPNLEFATYATHLHELLYSLGASSAETNRHKRFFIQFQEEHKEIDLPNRLTNLYKVFDRFGRVDLAKPYVHLNDTWSMSLRPLVDTQARLIFAVEKPNRGEGLLFHACDADSGYAVWSSPFNGKVHSAYGIAGQDYFYKTTMNRVYLIVNKMMRVFDKQTGMAVKTLSLQAEGKISELHDNGVGTIFLGVMNEDRSKNQILRVDTDSLEERGPAIPFPTRGASIFLGAGPYFLGTSHGSTELSVIDREGSVKLVNQVSPEASGDDARFFFHPVLTSVGSQLFYQEWATDKLRRLVKYNMETGVREEALDLLHPMKSQPKATPDGQTLVYLGEKQLVALGTTPLRFLWNTEIASPGEYFGKIDEFRISPNGDLIYGIQGDTLPGLFAYEVATGVERNFGPVEKMGRSHKLVGVLPTSDGTNKAIIAPYSF